MATPAVVSGKNHTISHKARGKKIMMPFTHELGNAFIEICFEDA
jgi:chemotaxis protein CheX